MCHVTTQMCILVLHFYLRVSTVHPVRVSLRCSRQLSVKTVLVPVVLRSRRHPMRRWWTKRLLAQTLSFPNTIPHVWAFIATRSLLIAEDALVLQQSSKPLDVSVQHEALPNDGYHLSPPPAMANTPTARRTHQYLQHSSALLSKPSSFLCRSAPPITSSHPIRPPPFSNANLSRSPPQRRRNTLIHRHNRSKTKDHSLLQQRFLRLLLRYLPLLIQHHRPIQRRPRRRIGVYDLHARPRCLIPAPIHHPVPILAQSLV